MKEVYDLLEKFGVYHIATVDKDGKPHVRPFGSRIMLNGHLYISCTLPKNVYDQLSANGSTEISACGDGMEWLRINAIAREVTDCSEKQRLYDISIYAAPNSPIKREIGQVAFFELTNATATHYGQEQKEYKW